MGTVYRAVHEETGDVVAIKALAPTYSHDSHFRSRFESEIKALINLDHPNIVRLLSYGQEDGNLYFAMELVEGKSLFHLQKSGSKFDWRDAMVVARDVASGLRHAHDRGIIHRDLKPGNLLKSDSGMIKITDFGIAKRFGSDHNTRDNVLGTLDFMSPEQAKGQPVTVRSDLFSLGVVLHTMLSGKPPFTANSMEESLRNLTSVPAPHLSMLIPDIPEEIDELVSKLVEKRPEDRIPTAQVLLHRLKEVEHVLKHHSEAKTAHGKPQTDSKSKSSSGDSRTVSAKDATEDLFLPTQQNDRAPQETVPDQTVEIDSREVCDEDLDFVTNEIDTPDYFNTVTDEQRKIVGGATREERKLPSGLFPIFTALIVVLSLAIFGVYQTFKRPSADALYEVIAAKADRPDRVHREIKSFLEFYPDDDRTVEIQGLHDIAKAIGYFKRMSLRSGMVGENRLSKMEREFVKIVEVSKDDSVEGFSLLSAFVAVHDDPEEQDPTKVECIQSAKSYLAKLRNDAENQIQWHEESIESAIERAQSSESPAERQRILNSVIELYGEIDWAQSKVEQAREALKIQDP